LIAIADTGPLYASLDSSDDDHVACAALLERSDLDLVIPALAVAEVCYLAGKRMGPHAEAAFLRGLEALEVELPHPEDWPRIAALVERSADFSLGATDASIVALAERVETDLLLTLDRRRFGAVRMRDGRPFRLLPE
jgi:hypothetical protein